MAKYRKVACHIWNDPRFQSLSMEEAIGAIWAITFCEEHDFQEFAGPIFRVADGPKRRPDLYTSEWRKIRLEVIEELGTICHYCGEDCNHDPTVDHLVPVCHGGKAEKSNLVVACRPCNSRKGGREGWA